MTKQPKNDLIQSHLRSSLRLGSPHVVLQSLLKCDASLFCGAAGQANDDSENNEGKNDDETHEFLETNLCRDLLRFILIPRLCDAHEEKVSEVLSYISGLAPIIFRQVVECDSGESDDFVTATYTSKRRALHWICLSKPWEPTQVRIILEAFPEGASCEDQEGNLPLHLIFRKYTTLAPFHPHTVDMLMAANPKAILTPNHCGYYPLHLACADPTILNEFYHRFHDECYHNSAGNNDTNETGANTDANVNDAARPSVNKNDDKDEEFDANCGILRQILQAYPEAAREVATQSGEYPLHCLCANPSALVATADAACAVFREVIEACPQAAAQPDANGYFPLHLLCANPSVFFRHIEHLSLQGAKARPSDAHVNQSPNHAHVVVAVLCELLEAHPVAASELTSAGESPIELLCRQLENVVDWPPYAATFVRLLMDKAAVVSTNNPIPFCLLHTACRTRPFNSDFIRAVMDIFPEAARTTDANGKFPLHLVFEASMPRQLLSRSGGGDPNNSNDTLVNVLPTQSTVEALLEAHPVGCGSSDHGGNYPLHLACRNWRGSTGSPREEDSSLDASTVIKCLLAAHPEAAAHKGNGTSMSTNMSTSTNTSTSSHNGYPLYWACQNSELVRSTGGSNAICELVAAFPEAAAECVSEDAGYPLHLLCRTRGILEHGVQAVRTVLVAHPEAAMYKTTRDDGLYPFHDLCRQKFEQTPEGTEVLRLLFHACPEAAKTNFQKEDSEENSCSFGTVVPGKASYPLHAVCDRWSSLQSPTERQRLEDILCELIKAFPQAAKLRHRFYCNKRCPAVEAVVQSVSQESNNNGNGTHLNAVLRTLLQVAPESLFWRHCTSSSPSGESTLIIDYILEFGGETMLEECLTVAYDGPFHCGPPRGDLDGCTTSAIRKQTKIAAQEDGETFHGDSVRPSSPLSSPMHQACSSMVRSLKVYAVIHRLFPQLVATRDPDGNLPLHLFCHQQPASGSQNAHQTYGPILEIASALISWYGKAIYMPDALGDVPFVAVARRRGVGCSQEGEDLYPALSLSLLLLREHPMVVRTEVNHWDRSCSDVSRFCS